MSKRKILSLALTLCMVAILAVGGTLAYFTDSESAKNTFTVGGVDIVLTEPDWTTGEADGKEAYPGEALAKNPIVTNDGNNPCFVRIKVDGLNQFVEKYGADATIDLRYIDEAGYHDGYNTTDWELYDGYYYYKKVLATKATAGDEYNQGLVTETPELFSQIVIPSELDNEAAVGSYDVTVFAEAVQAQGARPSWTAVKAMTVAEIAQWFADVYEAEGI